MLLQAGRLADRFGIVPSRPARAATRPVGAPPDVVGALLTIAGLGLLVLGLVEGNKWRWLSGPTIAVLAVFAGRLIDRIGYRRVMVPGAVIYAAAFALPLLLLTEERQWWLVIVSLIGAGIGMATVWPPLMAAATAGVPRDRVATVTATINTVQRIGGAVGSAIAVAWIAAGPSRVLATHRNPLWLLVIGGVGIALPANVLTDAQSTKTEALSDVKL